MGRVLLQASTEKSDVAKRQFDDLKCVFYLGKDVGLDLLYLVNHRVNHIAFV
jgi:hypothetical protein